MHLIRIHKSKFILVFAILACYSVAMVSLVHSKEQNVPALSVEQVTMPVSTFNPERIRLYVSNLAHISIVNLVVTDVFSRELPLTDHVLWRGIVLDHTEGGKIYEVYTDESGTILTGSEVRKALNAEQNAYRSSYGNYIIDEVVKQTNCHTTSLHIVADMLGNYPLTRVTYWRAMVLDRESGIPYEYVINADGAFVDMDALREAEFRAYQNRYGRFAPELAYRLQNMRDEDLVPVLIWTGNIDYAALDTQLALRYPKLATEYYLAGGQAIQSTGAVAHIDQDLYRRLKTDYNKLLVQSHLASEKPIINYLESKGYTSYAFRTFPGIYAELPKFEIVALNLSSIKNLDTMYWGKTGIQEELDWVASTIRAPQVWSSTLCYGHGCTGSGVALGMIDSGVTYTTAHNALHGKIITANVTENAGWHATAVASVLVGDNAQFPQYKGIAYGSKHLVTAKISGDLESFDVISWTIAQDAFAINWSLSLTGTQLTQNMHMVDRILDYVVRLWDPTIVVAAGNRNAGEPWNVTTPGKAYNVITVGSFEDHNNANWFDDSMVEDSCYEDPYIDGQDTFGDRNKPEVVSVGGSVALADFNFGLDGYAIHSGTSIAAPQVTALAALLIERYYYIRSNPAAIKSIILASAINNVDNTDDIDFKNFGDKDGAGGIDIVTALSIFDNGGWDYNIIQNINNPDDPTNPFDGPSTYFDFNSDDFEVGTTWANAGERIRAVIAWDSNPTVDFATDGTDQLSSRFHLAVWSPSGHFVDAISNFNNNYGILDFIAPETGDYTLRVFYYEESGVEAENQGLALAWVRMRISVRRIYLPTVIKK